jgi:hypothetical protein
MNTIISFIFNFLFCVAALQAADVVSVFYKDDDVFEIKGHYYWLEDSATGFPIKEGDSFLLSNETKQILGENVYYMTINLTSREEKRSCEFRSLQVNTNPNILIRTCELKSLEIVKRTYPVDKRVFDGYERYYYPCWDVEAKYQLVLEDGSAYELLTCNRDYDEQSAKERIKKETLIQAGDQVFWQEDLGGIKNCKYGSYLKRDDVRLEFGVIELYGPRRAPVGKKVVSGIQGDVFKFTRYLFYFDPEEDSHINEGAQLILVNRSIEQLPGKSYIVTLGVLAPGSEEIHYHKSLLTNDEDIAKIVKVKRISRSFISYFPRLEDEYEAMLEDGAIYRVKTVFCNRKADKDEIKEIKDADRDLLLPGDIIYWGTHYGSWFDDDCRDYKWMRYYRGGIRQEHDSPFVQAWMFGPMRNVDRLFRR